jgi:hypothetical protein
MCKRRRLASIHLGILYGRCGVNAGTAEVHLIYKNTSFFCHSQDYQYEFVIYSFKIL